MSPIKEQTKLEQKAGRVALRKNRKDAEVRAAERAIRDREDVRDARAPTPPYTERDPEKYRLAPIDEDVVLPEAIRSCIERADRAYNLAYRPGLILRLRRWIACKVWA